MFGMKLISHAGIKVSPREWKGPEQSMGDNNTHTKIKLYSSMQQNGSWVSLLLTPTWYKKKQLNFSNSL